MRIIIESGEATAAPSVSVDAPKQPPTEPPAAPPAEATDGGAPAAELLEALGAEAVGEADTASVSKDDGGGPPPWLVDVISGDEAPS